MATQHQKVAIAYDFDGTLAPGNMQELSFLPALKIKREKFWEMVKAEATEHVADEILCYMHLMIKEANHKNISINRDSIVDHGKGIKLFNGVIDWFDNITNLGKTLSLDVEHYIISSGLAEMIEGTSIAPKFKRIFASKFKYNADNLAEWPALCVNYTNKTQYLFRINKGALNINDHAAINKYVPQSDRPIPFSRMIYLGDGDTDVPCMKLVKEQGGHAIAVYRPCTKGAQDKAKTYVRDGRANAAKSADYTKDKDLYNAVAAILAKISSDISLNKQL